MQKKRYKQDDVDDLIVDFVCDGMLPFRTVDNPSFKLLMKTAFPRKTLLNRKQVVVKLMNEFIAIKDSLRKTFEKLEYICVTADCWSIYHR